MTEKMVWFILLEIIVLIGTVKIAQTNLALSVCFFVLGLWGASSVIGDIDEGEKRPLLTILGEIAGIVGVALAVIELTR
ncbi:hypothetical protein ACWD4K_35090 [Streptomyces gelaticus]